jgi:Flp pilus assembly protein TadG
MLPKTKLKDAIAGTKKFARDTAGATAVLFSLGTVVVMGSIAFGVDAANWFQTDRRLQTGADLAAIAGASNNALNSAFGYSGQDLTTTVTEEFERDGVDTSRLSSLAVNSPPLSGAFAGDPNAVEVIVSQDVQIFFAGMFVDDTPQAVARAVARTSGEGDFCILTLHPTKSGAVTFTGSTTALLGCGVATNSNAPDAVLATGSSIVRANVVTAVGGIEDNGNIETPVTFHEYANPIVDPFDGMTVPASAPCDHNNVMASGTQTLTPGVYCGDLRVNGDITFAPGTYVLDGGDFVINAGADAFGDDVTFIFTDSPNANNVGRTRFAGTATINFSAPDSGTYAGILFMQDPDAPVDVGNNSGTWMFNGTADSSYRGAFYIPSSEVEFSGNAVFANGCIRLVSGAATFIGNFDVSQQCNDPSIEDIEAIIVTLVE